jgi:hypothetical protein
MSVGRCRIGNAPCRTVRHPGIPSIIAPETAEISTRRCLSTIVIMFASKGVRASRSLRYDG